jgi:HNH endonuclease
VKLLSYEAAMLKQLALPTRQEVAQALLKALIRHGGIIKEFGSNEAVVDEIAAECDLNEAQRAAYLETVYRKQNRRKRSNLWHRLLFRAADSLAKENLVTRPTQTIGLTGRREWMLTEKGFDQALALSNISIDRKDQLTTKSFEVEKVVTKLVEATPPKHYNPVDAKKKIITVSRESALRLRGFRQAVIQAYDHRCAVCGLKISSPDSIVWEVQAAHIVPNGFLGRDDVWNGIALCHLHHWSFDVGWFTLRHDFTVQLSAATASLPDDYGKIGSYDVLRSLISNSRKITLPSKRGLQPHRASIDWHRENVFHHNSEGTYK